jgi:hypothetical protein
MYRTGTPRTWQAGLSIPPGSGCSFFVVSTHMLLRRYHRWRSSKQERWKRRFPWAGHSSVSTIALAAKTIIAAADEGSNFVFPYDVSFGICVVRRVASTTGRELHPVRRWQNVVDRRQSSSEVPRRRSSSSRGVLMAVRCPSFAVEAAVLHYVKKNSFVSSIIVCKQNGTVHLWA